MTGKVLVLEGGSRIDIILAVLEWCQDEIIEVQIDEVEQGKADSLTYRILETQLQDLRAIIGNIRELILGKLRGLSP